MTIRSPALRERADDLDGENEASPFRPRHLNAHRVQAQHSYRPHAAWSPTSYVFETIARCDWSK